MSDVSQWLAYWARSTPAAPALLAGSRTITYAELADRVARLAGGLRAEGIGAGDRVGLLARNDPGFFEVVMACARIGAIFVPLNDRLVGEELSYIAGHAGLSALVTDTSFAAVLGAVADVVPARRTFFLDGGDARQLDELRDAAPARRSDGVDMDSPLFICYTSGTTGRPKGAVLTHANLRATANAVVTCDALTRHDRAIMAVPLAFTGSCVSIGLPFLQIGASVIIESELVPEVVLDHVERNGATFISVVPLVYQKLIETDGFERRDLSALRVAKSGGAPVPEGLIRTIQARDVAMIQAFGITEGSGYNLALPSHLALAKLGSTGVSVMYQDACVLDSAGAALPPGEVGELTLRGPNVMRGYWEDPQATAETIRDGWLYTGDLASCDADGCFWIVDRKKDMLISGGINVYPAEIERVLADHPAVREVAVIATSDERFGEVPMACVVAAGPLTLEALNEFAADRLGAHKRPRALVLLDSLPRGMSGKVVKDELRRLLVSSGEPGARLDPR